MADMRRFIDVASGRQQLNEGFSEAWDDFLAMAAAFLFGKNNAYERAIKSGEYDPSMKRDPQYQVWLDAVQIVVGQYEKEEGRAASRMQGDFTKADQAKADADWFDRHPDFDERVFAEMERLRKERGLPTGGGIPPVGGFGAIAPGWRGSNGGYGKSGGGSGGSQPGNMAPAPSRPDGRPPLPFNEDLARWIGKMVLEGELILEGGFDDLMNIDFNDPVLQAIKAASHNTPPLKSKFMRAKKAGVDSNGTPYAKGEKIYVDVKGNIHAGNNMIPANSRDWHDDWKTNPDNPKNGGYDGNRRNGGYDGGGSAPGDMEPPPSRPPLPFN